MSKKANKVEGPIVKSVKKKCDEITYLAMIYQEPEEYLAFLSEKFGIERDEILKALLIASQVMGCLRIAQKLAKTGELFEGQEIVAEIIPGIRSGLPKRFIELAKAKFEAAGKEPSDEELLKVAKRLQEIEQANNLDELLG